VLFPKSQAFIKRLLLEARTASSALSAQREFVYGLSSFQEFERVTAR